MTDPTNTDAEPTCPQCGYKHPETVACQMPSREPEPTAFDEAREKIEAHVLRGWQESPEYKAGWAALRQLFDSRYSEADVREFVVEHFVPWLAKCRAALEKEGDESAVDHAFDYATEEWKAEHREGRMMGNERALDEQLSEQDARFLERLAAKAATDSPRKRLQRIANDLRQLRSLFAKVEKERNHEFRINGQLQAEIERLRDEREQVYGLPEVRELMADAISAEKPHAYTRTGACDKANRILANHRRGDD